MITRLRPMVTRLRPMVTRLRAMVTRLRAMLTLTSLCGLPRSLRRCATGFGTCL